MDRRTLALLAALGATTIYGLSHTIAKEVMPAYIQGFGFVQVRLLGAAILFWLVSLFIPQQKIDRADLPKMLLCALLGMVVNMLCFFKGIELSTPINSAVLITITPILSAKYTTVHLLKWLFLFGFIMALPISYPEFSQVSWVTLPFEAVWRFAFVVMGTTFMTYLLNVYALKQLRASTIGVFTYLQPLIGIGYAILVGADALTAYKFGAGGVVLLGVYLVTKRYQTKS